MSLVFVVKNFAAIKKSFDVKKKKEIKGDWQRLLDANSMDVHVINTIGINNIRLTLNALIDAAGD